MIDTIHTQATSLAFPEPLLASTDAYVTTICYIGSKSLSHVLSCIERCKTRLLDIGATSETARRQIITSVMNYWVDQPGIGVNIVDKLLNYTILTPIAVIQWALGEDEKAGDKLAASYIYEMVASTVHKVTKRVRQIVLDAAAPGLAPEAKEAMNETLQQERQNMKEMFTVMEDLLNAWASGSKDEAMEAGLGETEDEALIRQWGERWLRVFRRKMAVEDAFVTEVQNRPVVEPEVVEAAENGNTEMPDAEPAAEEV